MPGRPWFKAYSRDFLEGTSELGADDRSAYFALIFLMYTRGGALADDAAWLAPQMFKGCSVRRWNAIRVRLLEMGKITLTEDGRLTNSRVEIELENSAKEHPKFAENGAKGGRKRAENRTERSNISLLLTKGLGENPSIPEARTQIPESERPACLPVPWDPACDEPLERSRLPKLSDPEFKWAVLTSEFGLDGQGKKHPMVKGFFLDIVCREVCKAAGINDPNWRGDWDTVARWLHAGLRSNCILDAIEDRASRHRYKPPSVLRYFDGVVTTWAKEHPGPGRERQAA